MKLANSHVLHRTTENSLKTMRTLDNNRELIRRMQAKDKSAIDRVWSGT
jgi:hypothetical protein